MGLVLGLLLTLSVPSQAGQLSDDAEHIRKLLPAVTSIVDNTSGMGFAQTPAFKAEMKKQRDALRDYALVDKPVVERLWTIVDSALAVETPTAPKQKDAALVLSYRSYNTMRVRLTRDSLTMDENKAAAQALQRDHDYALAALEDILNIGVTRVQFMLDHPEPFAKLGIVATKQHLNHVHYLKSELAKADDTATVVAEPEEVLRNLIRIDWLVDRIVELEDGLTPKAPAKP
ncbi:hypothetical protein K2X33_16170 [bacterium]|nr:hypothetical protein [bacterium]